MYTAIKSGFMEAPYIAITMICLKYSHYDGLVWRPLYGHCNRLLWRPYRAIIMGSFVSPYMALRRAIIKASI
jgi:hypothetical protein